MGYFNKIVRSFKIIAKLFKNLLEKFEKFQDNFGILKKIAKFSPDF